MKVKKMELLKDDSSCHQLLFRKIYLYKIVIFAQLVKKPYLKAYGSPLL